MYGVPQKSILCHILFYFNVKFFKIALLPHVKLQTSVTRSILSIVQQIFDPIGVYVRLHYTLNSCYRKAGKVS